MNARVQLDDLDRRILDFLQVDCALSNLELSQRTHTSAATCQRRVRRLVDTGVIERRIAILAPDHADGLPAGLTAVIEITLDRQTAEAQAAFRQRAIADAAIQQCYRVTPGPDFVLVAYVLGTEGYQALAARLFTAAAHVRNVKTYFSVERGKFDPSIAVVVPPADASPGSPVAL